MTPDELRERIARAAALPYTTPGERHYSQADAVMPVLAEALAARDTEIARLKGGVDYERTRADSEARAVDTLRDLLRQTRANLSDK